MNYMEMQVLFNLHELKLVCLN